MLKKFRKKLAPTPGPDATVGAAPEPESAPPAYTSLPFDRRRSSATKDTKATYAASRRPSDSVLSPFPSYSGARPSPTGANVRGLRVVYQPSTAGPVDIIFVHGLGGHIWKTWAKGDDPELFWPSQWLPEDAVIGKARVFSFGYNSEFGPGSGKTVTNVADFAKDLLNDMRFGQDDEGHDFKIGSVPVIFVVHSMGGLVAKKAYVLGQQDANFRGMIQSVAAMLFLATPHRGSGSAETLNRVLMASFQSAKGFIDDLNKNSSALEDLNESFRHVAHGLSIWSFYETRATKIAGQRLMVVDKDSAVLGYPDELSRSLDADHVNICKFSTPDDANYVAVRNALRSLVGKQDESEHLTSNTDDVKRLLAITWSQDEDLGDFYRLWVSGTCDWFLQESAAKAWLTESLDSHVTWYSASPGSGKSILSAFMITYLRQSNVQPQFFFFRFEDMKKRSLRACLQSIAYQIAMINQEFCQKLQALSEEGTKLEKAEPRLIWQTVFQEILFPMRLKHTMHWVMDGLDDADTPDMLMELLRTLPQSQTPVHLLIISRKTAPLSLAFDRLSATVPVSRIEKFGLKHNSKDIKLVVGREVEHMHGTTEFKDAVKKTIVDRADGNMLWVRLVLQEVLGCYTEDDVQHTLDDIPDDMTLLYERMELAIVRNSRKNNVKLAKSLLRWAVCSRRSLRLAELSGALPGVLDMERTIDDVCGQFLVVDQAGSIGFIHRTARDYLTKTSQSEIAVSIKDGHEELCLKTLGALSDTKLRSQLVDQPRRIRQTVTFVAYASTSWTYHLRHGTLSDATLFAAAEFLRGQCVLTWIHALALLDELDVLVRAAKDFTTVATFLRRGNATKSPLLHRLTEIELLDRWSVDLVKLVAKFSRPLLQEPRAIYKSIPAVCPTQSVLHEQFHQEESVEISLSGSAESSWNDNLVRIMLPGGDNGFKVTGAGSHLAVLGASGAVYVWNAHSFADACTLRHGEPVTAMCLNKRGDRLATYGLKSIKRWSIPSGELIGSTTNVPDVRAMALEYAHNDKRLLAGTDDKFVRFLDTDDHNKGWQLLCDAPSREQSDIQNAFLNSPMCMRFNGDRTQVGIAYRGFPLTVWSLQRNRCIGRSKRSKAFRGGVGRPSTSWFGVDRFTFNPVTGHVIGVYRDGCIFKWHPVTDENVEVQSTADEIHASSDGKLFITSDTAGNIAVWSFAFMTKIYQLSSSDLVHGLSFCPDGQRFYDIRGRSLNVWEPNALLRYAEREASHSETASEEQASFVTHTSESLLTSFEPISALAVASTGNLFCVGNDEGSVTVRDAQTAESRQVAEFLNFQCVSHLALSGDGSCIVAADLSGDLQVKRLTTRSNGSKRVDVGVMPLVLSRINLQGRGIHQVLLNYNASLLLIVSDGFGQVCSVGVVMDTVSSPLHCSHERRYIQHPTDTGLILGFGPEDMRIYRWQGLKEIQTISYRVGAISGAIANQVADIGHTEHSQVTKAMLTQDLTHVLVQIKNTSAQRSVSKRYMIFDLYDLEKTTAESTQPLSYRCIPELVLISLEIVLAILPGFRLAFLDDNLWLCTFDLEPSSSEEALIRRHYFVPRDWATTECFELSCMLRDGTLLCPRDADVAIVTYSWANERT
ncbi:hypothetical protein LTS10_005799 [Elasticomyces elasticus]|nr:hypothetical protein LTS10_005799 [Elasticomyces elasticus]